MQTEEREVLCQPTSLFRERGREEDAQCRTMSELFPACCPYHAPVSPTKRSCGGVEDVQRYEWPWESFPPVAVSSCLLMLALFPGLGVASGGTSHCWDWGHGEEQGGYRSGC